MGAYVYMLSCADDSYYVGTATGSDLNQRVSEHQSGVRPGYTQLRRLFSSSGQSILIASQTQLPQSGI